MLVKFTNKGRFSKFVNSKNVRFDYLFNTMGFHAEHGNLRDRIKKMVKRIDIIRYIRA